jgi:hypothetical protein
MLRLSLAACLAGFAFASAAHATLTDTIAQSNASAFELDEAGYTRVGVGRCWESSSGIEGTGHATHFLCSARSWKRRRQERLTKGGRLPVNNTARALYGPSRHRTREVPGKMT